MSSASVASPEQTVNGLFLLFGLSLGFAAEFWVGMASIQIKYSHKLDAIAPRPRPAYRRGRWWFGFLLYFLNISFNFGSYMFASLNILAPTSALVIIINAILARAYFNERLTCFGYLGSFCIMIGCILSIVFGTHKQDELTIDSLFINADSYEFVLFTTIHGFICLSFGIIGSTKLQQKKLIFNNNQTNEIICQQSEVEFINTDDIAFDEKDEDDQKMEILPNNNEEMPLNNDYDDSNVIIDETLPIIPKSIEQLEAIREEEFKHMLRCLMLATATSGLVSWVQFLGKIVADLLFESVWNGNDQFTSIKPWSVLILLCILLLLELYLMSEIMRIFDAVLIVPIYNSLQILSTIALSAVYFDNFVDWSIKDYILFTLGLLFIFSGIGMVSHGQKHQSMAHHVDDKRSYLVGQKPGGELKIQNAEDL